MNRLRPSPARTPAATATLGNALQQAARLAPGEPALLGDAGVLSWAELDARVRRVAAGLFWLRTDAALPDTQRIAQPSAQTTAQPSAQPHALALKPELDDLVVLLAHAVAGVPLLPLHPALPEVDALRLAAAAGARRLSVQDCLQPPGTGVGAPMTARQVQPGDDLFLVPTSGSSGEPKLARLTHHAVLAAAGALTQRLPFGPADRWILTLPLSHVGGLSVVTRCLHARKPIVLVPQFSEDAMWTAMVRDGGTRLSAVPAIAHRLLAADIRGRLRGLSLMMLGGQAAPMALRQALADAGVPAVASYGLTESCAAAACQAPAEAALLQPGCGTVLAGMAVRIRSEDGAELPPDAPGRIELAGPSLLAGYAGRPGFAVHDVHGWFDTGDLGWLDEGGQLHVQGRRAEVIVTGGEKVVPGVVEAALREHPAVRDAVVFGLPDERWGAVVCAAVEGPAELARDATLPALLTTLLPPWARPRRLAWLPALPRLNTGKVDRRGTPVLAAAQLQPWPPMPGAAAGSDLAAGRSE